MDPEQQNFKDILVSLYKEICAITCELRGLRLGKGKKLDKKKTHKKIKRTYQPHTHPSHFPDSFEDALPDEVNHNESESSHHAPKSSDQDAPRKPEKKEVNILILNNQRQEKGGEEYPRMVRGTEGPPLNPSSFGHSFSVYHSPQSFLYPPSLFECFPYNSLFFQSMGPFFMAAEKSENNVGTENQ